MAPGVSDDHSGNNQPEDTNSSLEVRNIVNENYDIAIAMSSRADPVLAHCPGWGYLNI